MCEVLGDLYNQCKRFFLSKNNNQTLNLGQENDHNWKGYPKRKKITHSFVKDTFFDKYLNNMTRSIFIETSKIASKGRNIALGKTCQQL